MMMLGLVEHDKCVWKVWGVKRYKFGQVCGKWWWKEMQNVWGMSTSKRKKNVLKKNTDTIWVDIVLQKKKK